PDALLDLKPSVIMEKTGNIFNPDHFLLDTETSIVYRKEQFSSNPRFPRELLVRDRRYRQAELIHMFAQEGIKTSWSRHVHSGGWSYDYTPTDPRAKEILLLGRKK